MRLRRLDDLRNDVRKRADIEGATGFITDAELTEYLNQSIARLHQILKPIRPTYWEAQTLFTTQNGVSLYPLPNDFQDLIAVSVTGADSRRVPMQPFDRLDEPYLSTTAASSWSGQPWRYMIHGKSGYADTGSIEFLPVPTGAFSVRMFYVWAPTRLSADSDTFDGFGGFEEFVVLDAAQKCAVKDDNQSLAATLRADRDAYREDMIRAARVRDQYMPPYITDTRATFTWRKYTRRGRFT